MVYTFRTMARQASALKSVGKEADERLVIEAAQKDPRRFGDLYEANFERVYAFVARRVCDRDEAEDLTADVFHHALKNIGRFEWRGIPFAAWLYRIAANEIADHSNRTARERGNPDPVDADEPRFEEIEHRARLFRLVNSLPAEQRRVIVMRFAEQRSIREIADEIGRTEGAVKQLQFRGLQNLRARMSKRDG
jgi:RNA polymerase sigma-70 factor, ECF subfamily